MEMFSGCTSQVGEFDPLFLYLRIPLIWEILSILEILIQTTREMGGHTSLHTDNIGERGFKPRLPNHDGKRGCPYPSIR